MLLTKASEYALLSILCISDKKEPIDVENLSAGLMISRSFLAKILQKLTKAGILRSFKGVKGGFILAKEISDITILDIIRAVEDNPATVFECTSDSGVCPSNRMGACSIWPTLNKLQVRIDDFLSQITLQDILSR
ncbi:MAG: Rrf2 family transcriptional regulator [Campylobacteraceae bacterium]|jgi:Rrf2 family protein|nr:Rrf2 family transcriptional regulator [Campylobacteraceae bacterium]